MIAADADGVPLRHFFGAVCKNIGDNFHGRPGWKNIGPPGGIFFQDIVLNSAPQFIEGDILPFRQHQIHGHEDGGRGIDGHGGADLVQGNALKQGFHIPQGVDGHPNFADFPPGQVVVRVKPDLGGQVKGHGQPGLAGVQQIMIPLIGFLGRAEAGILPHGPEAASVGGGLHAPGVGKLPGQAQFFHVVEIFQIQRSINPLHRNARGIDEIGLSFGHFLQGLGDLLLVFGFRLLNAFQS